MDKLQDIDRFNKLIKEYQELFALNNWKISAMANLADEENHSAKTIADPRYLIAIMTIYPTLLKNESEWDSVIVHELIHVVMSLYDFFCDNMGKEDSDELFFIAREKSVSELTSIMMRIIHK